MKCVFMVMKILLCVPHSVSTHSGLCSNHTQVPGSVFGLCDHSICIQNRGINKSKGRFKIYDARLSIHSISFPFRTHCHIHLSTFIVQQRKRKNNGRLDVDSIAISGVSLVPRCTVVSTEEL